MTEVKLRPPRDQARARNAAAAAWLLPYAACLLAVLPAVAAPVGTAGADAPSRPAEKGCVWKRISDDVLGLAAWVQSCDFETRKVDFAIQGRSLAIRFSDGGGKGDPVVEVIPLKEKEMPVAGIRRYFAAHTEKGLARSCVLAPYPGPPAPPGVQRYTFVPNAAYQKVLDAKADPNEVPAPPCGDWGVAPDGIQYFEAQPGSGSRNVLFVRVGQDTPLFDEKTLKLLPSPGS